MKPVPSVVLVEEKNGEFGLGRSLAELGFRVTNLDSIANDGETPELAIVNCMGLGLDEIMALTRRVLKARPVPLIFVVERVHDPALDKLQLPVPFSCLKAPLDARNLRFAIEASQHPAAHEDHPPVVSLEEKETDIRLKTLLNNDLFKGLPVQLLESLAQSSKVRTLEAGEVLLVEGEEATCGFIVLSGRISITKSSEGGRELVLTLLEEGNAFGLFYLLGSFSNSSSARAQTDSRVMLIPEAAFKTILGQKPEIFQALSERALDQLSASYRLASSLAHARVEDRIVQMLLSLLPQIGRKAQNMTNAAYLYLTRKELAALTGTTEETAIRATRKLEKKGYLDLSRPGTVKILDPERLQNSLKEEEPAPNNRLH